MKNIILITLLSIIVGLVSCVNLKRDHRSSIESSVTISNDQYIPLINFGGDTLAYVRNNFVKNKEYYIGKSLSILLADLELPILKYDPAIAPNLTQFYSISFDFFSEFRIDAKIRKKETPAILAILFETPVPEAFPTTLSRKNKRKWTEEEIAFWGK